MHRGKENQQQEGEMKVQQSKRGTPAETNLSSSSRRGGGSCNSWFSVVPARFPPPPGTRLRSQNKEILSSRSPKFGLTRNPTATAAVVSRNLRDAVSDVYDFFNLR